MDEIEQIGMLLMYVDVESEKNNTFGSSGVQYSIRSSTAVGKRPLVFVVSCFFSVFPRLVIVESWHCSVVWLLGFVGCLVSHYHTAFVLLLLLLSHPQINALNFVCICPRCIRT